MAAPPTYRLTPPNHDDTYPVSYDLQGQTRIVGFLTGHTFSPLPEPFVCRPGETIPEALTRATWEHEEARKRSQR